MKNIFIYFFSQCAVSKFHFFKKRFELKHTIPVNQPSVMSQEVTNLSHVSNHPQPNPTLGQVLAPPPERTRLLFHPRFSNCMEGPTGLQTWQEAVNTGLSAIQRSFISDDALETSCCHHQASGSQTDKRSEAFGAADQPSPPPRLPHPLLPLFRSPPPSLTNLHPPSPRGPCSTAPSSRSRAEHRRRLFPHPARFRSWPWEAGVEVEAGAKSPPQAPPRPAANTHRRCCFSSSNRGREQGEGETTQSQIRRESHRAEQSTKKKNSWCVD